MKKKGMMSLVLVLLLSLVLFACDKEEPVDLSKYDVSIVDFGGNDNINGVTQDFKLPVKFENDVSVTWESDNVEVIKIEGENAKVTRSKEKDVEVLLTATLKHVDKKDKEQTLVKDPIKVKVLKLDLTPTVVGKVFHWMPDSVGADVTATVEIFDANPEEVVLMLDDVELIEGLDFEIVEDELTIFGEFLVEHSNKLGDYELTFETKYGQTEFKYHVVNDPTNTSIATKEIEVANMAGLKQAEITEPIADAPEVMITEVASDAGKFSYVEVFNNTKEKRNLKGHMLVFANTSAAINKGTIVNNNGLFGVPMGAIPFLIDEDFILEPFETGIIWHVYGGNDVPYKAGVGGKYDTVEFSDNANTWLFDWQGGDLKESDFRKHHGIGENVKIQTVRGHQLILNNTTAHDENGYGLAVRRANGFAGLNSSIANRAVQLMYFDPEIKHEAKGDIPEGATYFKMELEVLNPERDFIGEDGKMDLSKVPAINGRKFINGFSMRRVFYNDKDELVAYDNKLNFAADTGTAGFGNPIYHEIAEKAILSTALFYPGLNEEGEYRWGTGHGIEYAIPEKGSHLMRFIPRSEENYKNFVENKYSDEVLRTLYTKGLNPVVDEITNAKTTIIVPVDPAYVMKDAETKENTAGITSKYNLGLR